MATAIAPNEAEISGEGRGGGTISAHKFIHGAEIGGFLPFEGASDLAIIELSTCLGRSGMKNFTAIHDNTKMCSRSDTP